MGNSFRHYLKYAVTSLAVFYAVDLAYAFMGAIGVKFLAYLFIGIGFTLMDNAYRRRQKLKETAGTMLSAIMAAVESTRRFHEGALEIYEDEGVDARFPMHKISVDAVKEAKDTEITLHAAAEEIGVEIGEIQKSTNAQAGTESS
jgi:hypothetical protein